MNHSGDIKRVNRPDFPALSVVVPTLGRPCLVRTLESLVAAQGFEHTEVLVVGRIQESSIWGQVCDLCERQPNIRHLDVTFTKGDSSEKKNAGWRASRAALVAFLDDDVVVAADWPVQILKAFEAGRADLVSGPGLVPPDVPLFARLAGLALSSPAAGYAAGRYRSRSTPMMPIAWSRIIGCNMAYRRPVLEEIDGFDPMFWPGEEMIAAYRTQRKGYRLLFCSAAHVYHYPRQSPVRFMRQMYGYGATRIRLIRGGADLEPATLAPAAWVGLLIVSAAAAIFSRWALVLFAVAVLSHGLFSLAVTVLMIKQTRQWRDGALAGVIPLMHLSYGWGSWIELFRPNRDLGLRPAGTQEKQSAATQQCP